MNLALVYTYCDGEFYLKNFNILTIMIVSVGIFWIWVTDENSAFGYILDSNKQCESGYLTK